MSKGRKKGYDEYEIVLILRAKYIFEKTFLCLHKLTQRSTFGIIYFLKI